MPGAAVVEAAAVVPERDGGLMGDGLTVEYENLNRLRALVQVHSIAGAAECLRVDEAVVAHAVDRTLPMNRDLREAATREYERARQAGLELELTSLVDGDDGDGGIELTLEEAHEEADRAELAAAAVDVAGAVSGDLDAVQPGQPVLGASGGAAGDRGDRVMPDHVFHGKRADARGELGLGPAGAGDGPAAGAIAVDASAAGGAVHLAVWLVELGDGAAPVDGEAAVRPDAAGGG